MRQSNVRLWSVAPLAIGSAVVWGVVEFAALCRSRWVQQWSGWRGTRMPPAL